MLISVVWVVGLNGPSDRRDGLKAVSDWISQRIENSGAGWWIAA
ncbi:hypothetical protein [Citreimonas sp.]